MLNKTSAVDKIETLENGVVQIRVATRIVDDGIVIASSFHRHVVTPGQDYSQEDQKVQAICAAVHTPQCIAAYQNSISSAPYPIS